MDDESAAAREERHKKLWRELDIKRKGYLEMPDLRSGLAQMNHREYIPIHYTHRDGRDTGVAEALAAAGRTAAQQ